jgi:D-glycero-alpha-D-manno-heptose-7-phosphate kinase
MIIISKCPLRISLAGGSTDLQEYLDKYEKGKVISFTPNLFTYIVLKKSSTRYYKIVYSKIENVLTPEEIQNDIARVVLTHFNMPPVEVMFTADIPSTGSGLASSSSYLISMIKACISYKDEYMSNEDIGKLAIRLEREFNPLTGYQDIYGCLNLGFKCISFNKDGLSNIEMLSSELFKKYNMYLISTDSVRSSTNILSTLNYDEVHKLSELTDKFLDSINNSKYDQVLELINIGWQQKKLTSPSIINKQTKNIENKLKNISGILAWRLIGAGNGGYFLVISNTEIESSIKSIKISLYEE